MTREHACVIYWYIQNAGAKGFGPFAHLEPRKIIRLVEIGRTPEDFPIEEWRMMDGFEEKDLEEMPPDSYA